MGSKFWPKGGLPGILHHFKETLVAFEFTNTTTPKPHSLLFIGGLGDGLATTPYIHDLVKALDQTPWSVFTINLTSSYRSWGLSHLARDTNELAHCINYIRSIKPTNGKLTLMGHSTGCQDLLHYLSAPNPDPTPHAFDPDLSPIDRPFLDGAIMQAAVSDREVITLLLAQPQGFKAYSQSDLKSTFAHLISMSQDAESLSQENPCDTLLPLSLTSKIYPANHPLTARRFLSLTSPSSPSQPRDEDVFSSDLGDEVLRKTFGKIRERGLLGTKLLVLQSGADQSVPKWVNMEKLMGRWAGVLGDQWDYVWSGIIPGASHALSDEGQEEARRELVRRVVGYLGGVVEGGGMGS